MKLLVLRTSVILFTFNTVEQVKWRARFLPLITLFWFPRESCYSSRTHYPRLEKPSVQNIAAFESQVNNANQAITETLLHVVFEKKNRVLRCNRNSFLPSVNQTLGIYIFFDCVENCGREIYDVEIQSWIF